MNTPSKRCSRCKQDKALEAFHFCANSPDKRQYWCVECRAAYDRARNELQPLGEGPLQPESITRMFLNWKPPVVSVRIVQVSVRKREAVG